MRRLLLIFLVLYTHLSFSQNESLIKQFVIDILKAERPINKGQTVKIKTSLSKNWPDNFTSSFKANKESCFIKFQRKNHQNDTLVITRKERSQILKFLKQRNTLDIEKLGVKNVEFTKEENWSVLTLEWKKYAYLEITKPNFLRNNSIAVCSEVYLCDANCGYTYFGFYKLIDGKWTQWIPVSNGFF